MKFVTAVLIALLLIQYFFNRSLWFDEAMLALNIIGKSYHSLLQPLDYHQVSPIFFLIIEKALTSVFGNSELILRLFPLLSAIACLPLLYHAGLSLTGNKTIALAAMCLLGCTGSFIYYSSEVKQYSTDLLVLLSIYCLAFTANEWVQRNRLGLLSAAGAFAIFLSNVSVIALFTVGLLFLYDALKERKTIGPILLMLVVWMAGFSINYFLFVRNHPSTAYMQEYWKESFMPLDSLPLLFGRWLPKKTYMVFHELLPSIRFGMFYVAGIIVYLAGIVRLVNDKNYRLLYLCLFPVVIHLLLSAFRLYPFELRLMLYQVPLYLLLMANGMYGIANLFTNKNAVTLAMLAFIVFFSCGFFYRYPLEKEEIRPVIADINRRMEPGDLVYVYYGSDFAFRYYEQIGLIRLPSEKIINGSTRVPDHRKYVQDLSAVSGRTWLLFSHVYPFDGSRQEEKDVLTGLRQRGRLLENFQSYGSAGYLFDLKSSVPCAGIIMAGDNKTNEMAKLNHHRRASGAKNRPAPGGGRSDQPGKRARLEAEKDINNDVETSAHSPNDDLDEGELARLGEENNPVE